MKIPESVLRRFEPHSFPTLSSERNMQAGFMDLYDWFETSIRTGVMTYREFCNLLQAQARYFGATHTHMTFERFSHNGVLSDIIFTMSWEMPDGSLNEFSIVHPIHPIENAAQRFYA